MSDVQQKVGVGVGVIVKRDGKVLIGKRVSSHGNATWGFPGGKLDFLESVEDCARRETWEETGLTLGDIEVHVTFTNDLFVQQQKHYITLWAVAECTEGEPQVLEPDKMQEWSWCAWDELPTPLFLPVQNLLNTGFNPFV